MNKLALLLFLSAAPVFAQSSGLPSTVPGTVGNCVKIGTNNVATDNGSLCGTGGSATGYGYTFRLSAGTYFAHNDATGVDDFSGTDAAVVIRSAIANNSAVCGHLKFAPAIYNLNTLVAETAAGFTNSYAIGFPGQAGTNLYCQWTVLGDGAPPLRDQFSNPVQTNGVILYVTPTAVASVASTVMIDDIFQRPPTTGTVANSVWFNNIGVRFPDNQRGNETGIDATQGVIANFDNVMADFNTAQASLAFPVAGTLGLVGITSTKSSHEENYMKNTFAVGYDVGLDIQSEHTVLINTFALDGNKCIQYGVNGGSIFHASSWQSAGWGECARGLTLGANMQAGALLNISGLDIEDAASGIFAPVYHAAETTSGNGFGFISYSRVLAGTGLSLLTQLFDGGGGTNFCLLNSSQLRCPSITSGSVCGTTDTLIGTGAFTSDWTALAFNGFGGALQKTASGAAPNPSLGVDAMLRTCGSLPSNQSIQITTVGAVNGAESLFLRMNTAGTGYQWKLSTHELSEVVALGAGGNTSLTLSCPTVAVGDSPKLSAVGTTITCTNGASVVNATSSTYSTGFSGISIDQRTASGEFMSTLDTH